MSAVASAPGKVILVGEHFVVENEPAIAVAINLRARVRATKVEGEGVEVRSRELGLAQVFRGDEPRSSPLYPVYFAAKVTMEYIGVESPLRVEVFSDIPPASGMGSSAAVAVATVAAVAKALGVKLVEDEISKLAYRAEEIVHGKPSGIDNTISTYGGLLLYVRGNPPSIHQLDNPPDFNIILVDTSIPRNTKKAVLMVADLLKRYDTIKLVMDAIGDITRKAWDELQKGGNANLAKIGELMNINHGLLSAIGVSSKKIEEITHLLREIGAYGSKLTGAGIGGFVIGVSDDKNIVKIKQQIEKRGYRFFISKINKKGVQVYEEK